VYAALGTQVSVVEMTSGLLPGVDRDWSTFCRPPQAVHRCAHAQYDSRGHAGRASRSQRHFCRPEVQEPQQVFEKVLVRGGPSPNAQQSGSRDTALRSISAGLLRLMHNVAPLSRRFMPSGRGRRPCWHKAHEGRVAVQAIAGDNVAFEPHAVPASCLPIRDCLVWPDRKPGQAGRPCH